MSDKTLNTDKAKELHEVISNVLKTCGGDCDKCILEDVCDDLDVLTFRLFQKY